MHASCMQHVLNMTHFHFVHIYIYTYINACARLIDDLKALVQSTNVHSRHVYDNLHERMYMSVTYTTGSDAP